MSCPGKRKLTRYSISVSLMLLPVLISCSISAPSSAEREQEIIVQIGDGIDRLEGVRWRKRPHEDTPTDFVGIDEPISLTLKMPEGPVWRTMSFATFFDQSDGKITSVVVTPLERSVPFADAVAILEFTLRELGAKSGDPAYLKTEAWKRSPPMLDLTVRRSLKTAVAEDVELFAEIRPADSGWYLSYTFDLIERPASDPQGGR